MINKIAAAIGNAAAGPPPPPPPQTATSIRLMQPLKGNSGGVDTRKFATQLKHQFDVVNLQVEHGLLNVKRTCNYIEQLLRASEYASDGRRATAELAAKWSEGEVQLQDQMSHFVHGCTLLQEVTMHSYTATESFRKGAQAEVAALYAFYKSAQARRRDTTKEHARMVSAWASMEESLAKERRECAKAYSDLRAAQDAKDKEEVAETANKELYPKLLKRWKGAREACVKKFAAFEKSFERARSVQEANDAAHLPHMLEELERIERERLALLAEFTTRFGALYSTWAADIRSSAVLIEKVAPALQGEKAVSSLLDSWMLRFGMPPALQPVRYDLPCSAAVVAGEELPPENAPLLAAIGSAATNSYSNGNGNAAATPLSPSSSSAAMAAPSGGFSSPPLSPASTGLVGGARRAAAPGPPPPPPSLGSGSYPPVARTAHVPPPIPQANNGAAAAAAAAGASASAQVRPAAAAASTSPLVAPQPPIGGSSDASSRASAVPPPLAPAAAAVGAVSPAAATAAASPAVAAAGAARSTVKVGVIGRTMRAPPPSLPTKRKPKLPGEPDIDISCLPPPPLPPPVTQESASYHRMSMTTAAAAAAAGRQSVARAAGPPPLPGAADSSVAAAAAASPSSRGPPPLPTGVARVGPPPPPLPVAASVSAAAAPVAVEQLSSGAAAAEPELEPEAEAEAASQPQGQPSESQPVQSSVVASDPFAPTTEDFDASAPGPDQAVSPSPAVEGDAPAAEPQLEAAAAESGLGATDVAATAAADEAAPAEPAVEAAADPAADQVESDPSAAAADDVASATDDGGQQQGWPATALYDFSLSEDTADIHYLSFAAGDRVTVLHNDGGDWLYGSNGVDTGFFAANYVEMDEQ